MKRQSMGRDAIWLTVSKMVNLLISLISGMLLSRFRTLEEYGTYSQMNMVVAVAITFFMMGLPNSINYFFPRAETQEKRDQFLSTYYSFSTLLSVVTGAVLVLALPLFSWYFKNDGMLDFPFVLGILPWTKVIGGSVSNILVASNKAGKLALFTGLNSIGLLLAILVVKWFDLSFLHYMILYVVIESVFAIWVYGEAALLSKKKSLRIDWSLLKRILVFSIPMGLATLIGTLKTNMDVLVIGRLFTTQELAVYANAAKEMPVTIIATSLTAVLLPQMSRLLNDEKKEKAISLWRNATSLSYLFICLFATGLFTFAPDVMTLLYSQKYVSGAPVFRVYAIVLLFRCTYFGMVLNMTGNTKLILWSSIGALVISLLLNYVFSLWLGFIGPALATFLATAGSAFFLLSATSKVLSLSLRTIFPWKSIAAITAVNIAFGGVFYIAKGLLPLEHYLNETGESVALGAVWSALYLAASFRYARQKYRSLKV